MKVINFTHCPKTRYNDVKTSSMIFLSFEIRQKEAKAKNFLKFLEMAHLALGLK
jgi:hypothetical protein